MDSLRRNSRLITVAASLVVVAAMYVAKGVLIPFALAVLVSFLLGPLVSRLHGWRFPRALAVVSAVLLLLAVTIGVDRKSTRLNSSHQIISYAVFCLKK